MRTGRESRSELSSAMRGILGLLVVALLGLSVLALSLWTLIPGETLSAWTVEVGE